MRAAIRHPAICGRRAELSRNHRPPANNTSHLLPRSIMVERMPKFWVSSGTQHCNRYWLFSVGHLTIVLYRPIRINLSGYVIVYEYS